MIASWWTSGTSTSRNAYMHDLLFDHRGRLHVTWVYREAGQTWASKHDLHYAYSDDQGRRWKNNAGDVIADTRAGGQILLDTPGIVVREIPVYSWLMNQCAMTLDSANRPHVATYHMSDPHGQGTGRGFAILDFRLERLIEAWQR